MSDDPAPKRSPRGRLQLLGAAALCAVVLAFVAFQVRRLASEATEQPAPTARPSAVFSFQPPDPRPQTYSNIYKFDYVGPETCGQCHPGNHKLWSEHPHSKMTRNATAATVVGNFSGAFLEYGGGRAVFAKERGEFTMTLYRGERAVRQFRVTRTIGSRFVQMYIGVQTEGEEPRGDPAYRDEVKLPFSYSIARAEWFPETYDENPPSAEFEADGTLTHAYAFDGKASKSWKRTCAKCHNTYPYALRFDADQNAQLVGFPAGDIALKGKPLGSVHDGAALSQIDTFDLVTLGISCESCHFGGREHALAGSSISFVPKSSDVELKHVEPEGEGSPTPYAVNSICRQCHAAVAQGPIYPNSSASWNSREAADLTAGACATKIACINCHNPHEAGPKEALAPASPAQLESCGRCHDDLKTPQAASAHAAHPPGVEVQCLDCHMPRIVHGLSSITRTHLISKPSDPRMLSGNYPNACNLCHLDKSATWTLNALSERWHVKPDLGAFKPSDEPLGPVWLKHEVPVVRQVAANAYARSPLGKAELATILPILNDDDPPTRMFGLLAVEAILGRRIPIPEYAPWAAPDVRKRQVTNLAGLAPPPAR